MTPLRALFICEGSSDLPLATLVETLVVDRGRTVQISSPDYALLESRVGSDLTSKVGAGLRLLGEPPDFCIVHRDADRAGTTARRREIETCVLQAGFDGPVLPIVPVTMTEAWLLLDERAIRHVAGKPNGRSSLPLPRAHEVEAVADPKALLRESVLAAGVVTGRRRDRLKARFDENRRRLLDQLDPHGPVSGLASFKALLADIDSMIEQFNSP